MGLQQIEQAVQARRVGLPATRHEARGELDGDGVHVLVFVQNLEQPLEMLRLAAEADRAAHIEGVAIAAPDDVEEAAQFLVAGRGQQRHLQPRPHEGIGDHD